MIFSSNRDQLRRQYCDAWRKHREKQPLEPLEKMLAEVIALHPEYHAMLDDPDQALGHEYTPEMGQTNPFLHMGMHIAIREQLATGRPAGIVERYQKLLGLFRDVHDTEHRMLECLGEILWLAQRNNTLPDEQAYLRCLDKIPKR